MRTTKHPVLAAAVGTIIGHYIYDHRESLSKTVSAIVDAGVKAVEKAMVAQQLEKLKAMDFVGQPAKEGDVSFAEFMNQLAHAANEAE